MSEQPEYYFKEGCYIQEWLNSRERPNLSVARVRVEPKTQTRLHVLIGTVERYAVLEGEGQVTVADKHRNISAGDVVIILPGQPQKIKNLGDTDLVFLAICTPRFVETNYRDIEDG